MRSFSPIVRGAPALALAATLLVSALGPPSSVRADPAIDPAARVQIVIKNIHIFDDREGFASGEGEMRLRVHLGCYAMPTECFGFPSITLVEYEKDFSAGTGETVNLDLVLPQADERRHSQYDASGDTGYPLYPGQRYKLYFQMNELDSSLDASGNEWMGETAIFLSAENDWAIGTYNVRAFPEESGRKQGDYSITYEIRPAPLPDLKPVNIQVDDRFGSAEKRVCMAVQNVGPGDAGPFEVVLRVDGVVPPGGGYSMGGLAPGQHTWACVETTLPDSGQHLLAAMVDERRARVEFNETNNVFEQSYTAPTPTPTPTPSPAQADLTVSTIRVNGHVPDGKDDCKDGKNDIAVVVKNAGTKDAGDFVVRLVVDADSGAAKEEGLADGLDAGQEQEVRFDDVRLKNGERSLQAIADAAKAIAESKEDNNDLKVTARCKDDD